MDKARYIIQWDAQPAYFCRTMCSLLETQFLVDMTLISNSYSLKVHKCVMAASSPYFKDQLQKEPSIDKVVMNDVKHSVLKALIEFIYSGETSIYEENIHELIAVANYFELRGLKTILPDKFGITCNEDKDSLLEMKPPIFFCKNQKVRSVRQNSYTSDQIYGEGDVKVVLDGNFQLYDNSKRRSQTSVVDEAHVALAKEEAASRFALQMLQKDLNVTSNLLIIEDTCTEATVETSLTSQCDESNSMPADETNVIRNKILDNQNTENYENKVEKEEKCEEIKDYLQILQNDIPNDYPILLKQSDGSYVNVTSEMFHNLAHSGAIQYQVVQEDGTVGDFQHYICNNYDVNTEKKPDDISKDNQPFTLKQLVAENKYLVNLNPNINSMSGLNSEEIVEEIPLTANEIVRDVSFNNYIMNEKDSLNYMSEEIGLPKRIFENQEVQDNNSSDNSTERATPLRGIRGRPRKIKLENDMKISPIKMFPDRNIKISEQQNSKKDIFEDKTAIKDDNLTLDIIEDDDLNKIDLNNGKKN